MKRACVALAAFTVFSTAGPIPAAAQDQSTALEQLQSQLPGKLVNDPSRIDWASYGDLDAGHVVDESIPGGGVARRFTVKNAGEFIYSAGANIPLTANVRRGDQVTLGFYARAIESKASDGKGLLRVRFQKDAPPYPGFGEKTLAIGPEWEWYEVTTMADQGLQRKDGIVALQFGRTRQTLEIGQAIVITGASAIASAETPKPRLLPAKVPGLPPSLEGVGTLINDSGKGNWVFASGNGSHEILADTTLWGTAINRVTSPSVAPDLAGVSVAIPIGQALETGQDLLLAVAARTVSADAADGRARIRIHIEDGSVTGEPFSDNILAFGSEWQLVKVRTRSPRAIPAGTARLVLNFGLAAQVVELGPVYVIKPH